MVGTQDLMEDLYIQSGLHIIEKKDHYILKNGGDNQIYFIYSQLWILVENVEGR